MTKKSCKKFYLPDKEMSRANGLDYHLDLRAWKVRKYEFDSICYFDWQVDESVQTVGDEVVSAPADLWESKPASAEYWYKKKGWRKKLRCLYIQIPIGTITLFQNNFSRGRGYSQKFFNIFVCEKEM